MHSLTARDNIISFEQSQACFTLIYVSLYHVICPFQFNTTLSCICFFFFHFMQEYLMLRQQEMLTGTFTKIVTLIMFSMNFSLCFLNPIPVRRTHLCQRHRGMLYKHILYGQMSVPPQFIDKEMIYQIQCLRITEWAFTVGNKNSLKCSDVSLKKEKSLKFSLFNKHSL